MPLLKFTLSEEGVNTFREALACLNKFSEGVSLEAKRDRLSFSTLNSSKSAYVCCSFAANRIFSRYHFEGSSQYQDRFSCKLYNKALLLLFKARSGDPLHDREKDTTIDKCDVAVEDEPGKKSRFIVRITCRNGITTKYRLPFEVGAPVHAKFGTDGVNNAWSISSRTLRQLMDHFGPGIEYLDIHSEDNQLVKFTCFTDRVANGDEVLKKPLHTSIAVERDEFEDFEVASENLHIVISVKDFRAIIHHAALIGQDISARYSTPSRPMQLKYDGDGLKCEFLLMTVGERGAAGQRTKKARANNIAPRPQLEAVASRATSNAPTPAPRPTPRQDPMPSLRPPNTRPRPSQRPPASHPELDEESLFVTQDNDEQFNPYDPDENEDEDEEDNARLGWDASGQQNPSFSMRSITAQGVARDGPKNDAPHQPPAASYFEPTQRISDVRKYGLFGD